MRGCFFFIFVEDAFQYVGFVVYEFYLCLMNILNYAFVNLILLIFEISRVK